MVTTTVGTPLGARNLTRDYKRHLEAAGLPKTFRFSDMRHTAASLLIADGLPITAVSSMLGHALTLTTLNTYADVLPGRIGSQRMRWSASWNKPGPTRPALEGAH